jgi:hypothetical protein
MTSGIRIQTPVPNQRNLPHRDTGGIADLPVPKLEEWCSPRLRGGAFEAHAALGREDSASGLFCS